MRLHGISARFAFLLGMLILVSPLWAQYPLPSDSTSFLYFNRSNGTVIRHDLLANRSDSILASRTNAGKGIGLIRGSGRQFSLLYADTALHRKFLTGVGAQGPDSTVAGAYDSVVTLSTDPWFASNSFNTAYAFQTRNYTGTISKFTASYPSIVSDVVTIADVGYQGRIYDGAVDEANYYLYAIYRDAMMGTRLYRYSTSGGTGVDVLPSGNSSRKFTQMALMPDHNVAVLYDSTLKQFVKLDIGSQTWLGSANFVVDSVADFVLTAQGDIIWANKMGVYRNNWSGTNSSTISTTTNVVSLVLDDANVRPTIDAQLPKVWPVASTGTANPTKNYQYYIHDYNYDSLQCAIESAGAALRVKAFVLGCNVYLDGNNATPGVTDSLKLIVGDTHGGRDTVLIKVPVQSSLAPTFTLPSTDSIKIFNEKRWTSPVVRDPNDRGFTYSVYEVYSGASYYNAVAAVGCTQSNQAYLAQTFMPTSYEYLIEMKVSMGYTGPTLVRIVQGSDALMGSVVMEEVFRSSGTGNMRSFVFKAPSYLSMGTTYTMVQIPLESKLATECIDGQEATQYTTIMGIVPSGINAYSVGTDSVQVGMVASDTLLGKTKTYRVTARDTHSVAYKEIKIKGIAGTPPAFVAGNTIRLPMRVGAMANSPSVPAWLPELTTAPRTYVFELVDSSQTLIQYLSMPPEGNLQVNVAQNTLGTQAFRVKRCYMPGITNCSAWQLGSVVVSSPPSLVWTAPDSVKSLTTTSTSFSINDPDAADASLHKAYVQPVKVAAGQTIANNTIIGAMRIAQTFQAKASGPLHSIQIKAKIYGSNFKVSIYRLTGTTWTSTYDGNQAEYMGGGDISTIPGSTIDVVTLPMVSVYLDSGKYYGILIGDPVSESMATPFDISLDSVATSVANFRGQALSASGGMLSPFPNDKDITMQVFVQTALQGSYDVSRVSGNAWKMVWSPALADQGVRQFALSASDGAYTVLKVGTVRIAAPPAVTETFKLGSDVRVAMSKDGMEKNYFSKWATGTAIGGNFWFESRFLTAADTGYLDTVPRLDVDGSLSFGVKANRAGSARFIMRACSKTTQLCGAWDTAAIRISTPPTMSWVMPTELSSGKDTTMIWTLADVDAGDIDSLKLSVEKLLLSEKQSTQTGTFTARAIGQYFRLAQVGTVGEIRVFAKFPKPFVRYMIGDSIPKDSTNRGPDALVEGYAPVVANVLQWHSIPVHKSVSLLANHSYQFSVGYDDTTMKAQYGIDTVNSYAKGVLLQWLETPRYDSTTGKMDDHMTENPVPKKDLMFEISLKQGKPAWMSVNSPSKSVRNVVCNPAVADTGSIRLLVTLGDGVAFIGGVKDLEVKLGIDPTQIAWSGVSVTTAGQAVQFESMGGTIGGLPDGVAVTIKIKGDGLDTSFVMGKDQVALAPLKQAQYIWKWSLGSGQDVYQSGLDTFQIKVNVHTPPKLQTWYLIGFGANVYSFDSLDERNLVYRWDEGRTSAAGFGRYASREELSASEVGAGYWYFAEKADSIIAPLFDKLPAAVTVAVQNQGTGWNMISNPWNWPIALDDTHEYYVWNDSIGGYGAPVTLLNPMMGAWVNVVEESEIVLKPTPKFWNTKSGLARQSLTRVVSQQDWLVQVRLVSGKLSDSWNFIGVNTRAQAGLDAEDGSEPPTGLGEHVSLAFVGANRLLARDVRPTSADASWKLALSADRARSAQLEFEGVAQLRAAGLRLIVILANGDVREVPESGVVPVALARGKVNAELRIIDAESPVALTGAMRNLQVTRQASGFQIQFEAPISMEGTAATIEFVNLDGKVLARASIASMQQGINQTQIKVNALRSGVYFVRIQAGSSKLQTKLVLP